MSNRCWKDFVHEPQSYQNYLNSLNVHVDVKTTDGTTVFSNAKEGGDEPP